MDNGIAYTVSKSRSPEGKPKGYKNTNLLSSARTCICDKIAPLQAFGQRIMHVRMVLNIRSEI